MAGGSDYEPGDEPRRVIRPTSGAVWLAITGVAVLLLLGDVVIRGGWAQALLIAPWPLLLVWFVYVFVWAPHIAADARGVTVHNILRSTRIPWAAIDDIVLRWQIEFRLKPEFGRRPVQAWGAPARRPTRRTREQPADREAEILLEMREGADDLTAEPRITHDWDLVGIVSFVVLAVWAAVAVAVAG